MTIPKMARVRDMAMGLLSKFRHHVLQEELALAPHLRGNELLYGALVALITSRINGRASQPPPSDPVDCRASMERDYELRWLLSRLESAYRSPVNQAADSEQSGQ